MLQDPTRPAGRFDALDTLRCLAVLVMVQGHTFYLVIDEAVRQQRWYGWHDYVHGYTAPAFLFGAGLAFGVTTLKALPKHGQPGPTLYKRLYRYLSLFAIGYALQLPPMAQDPDLWSTEHLRVFSRVEALQHIAAALVFAQVMTMVIRRRAPYVAVMTAVGFAVVLYGPAVARWPLSSYGSQAVAAYMTADAGSTFPVVPWAGFVLLGITVAAFLPSSTLRGPQWRVALAFVAVGLALVGLSLQLDVWAPDAFGEHFYWKTSPYFFLRRLGWVLVMLGAFAGIDFVFFRRKTTPGPVRRWIRLISQQSLVAYVAHLAILYGSPLNLSVRRYAEHQLGLAEASALVVAICLFLTALSYAWRELDRRWQAPFLFVRRTGVAVMATLVLTAAVRSGARPPEAVVAATLVITPGMPLPAPPEPRGQDEPSHMHPAGTLASGDLLEAPLLGPR